MKLFLFLLLFLFSASSFACDSTKNGKCKVYDDSGRLILKARYEDTLRHGVWTEYDSSGLITKKTKYKRGRVMWIYIYKSGRLSEIIDKKGVSRKRKNCGC